jgi:hypothetical protein
LVCFDFFGDSKRAIPTCFVVQRISEPRIVCIAQWSWYRHHCWQQQGFLVPSGLPGSARVGCHYWPWDSTVLIVDDAGLIDIEKEH